MPPRLVLASASPRRAALLEEAGLRFDVEPSGLDEPPPEEGEDAEAYAGRLALAKAEAVARRLVRPELRTRPAVVLGADTVVECAGAVFGKPRDRAHAREMLKVLSGSRQTVVTAVALVGVPDVEGLVRSSSTELEMSPMSEDEIAAYVGSGESDGKAGAYAIQETGDRFVRIVKGSRTNVVGLPVELVLEMLAYFAPSLAGGAPRGDDAPS